MLKKTIIALTLPLLLLVVISLVTPPWGVSAQPASQTARSPQRASSAADTAAPTGTLQKMIVENGSATMDLDLNRLNGINSAAQNLQQARFALGANSFFPVLVFNDQLRGPIPGSMALIPQAGVNARLQQSSCGARRVSQAAGSRKTSFGSRDRSCRARQPYRIHVFQHPGTPV